MWTHSPRESGQLNPASQTSSYQPGVPQARRLLREESPQKVHDRCMGLMYSHLTPSNSYPKVMTDLEISNLRWKVESIVGSCLKPEQRIIQGLSLDDDDSSALILRLEVFEVPSAAGGKALAYTANQLNKSSKGAGEETSILRNLGDDKKSNIFLENLVCHVHLKANPGGRQKGNSAKEK